MRLMPITYYFNKGACRLCGYEQVELGGFNLTMDKVVHMMFLHQGKLGSAEGDFYSFEEKVRVLP